MPNDMTPTRGYAFKDFSRREPTKPLPGDRLDTELDKILKALKAQTEYFTRTISPDGTIRGKIITKENIRDDVLDHWTEIVRQNLKPHIEAAQTAEKNTQNWLTKALAAAQAAEENLSYTEKLTSQSLNIQKDVGNSAQDALSSRARAEKALQQTQIRQQDAQTSASSARLSEDMAYRWAEKLDGPVYVPNGGDPVDDGFYSAKYWAQAVSNASDQINDWYDQIEIWYNEIKDVYHPETKFWWEDFRGTYYGPFPDDPPTDPLGNPPTEGDLYFNTTTGSMRVFDGTNWVSFEGEAAFLGLVDTPGVYTGSELFFTRVNQNADALEFYDLQPTFDAIAAEQAAQDARMDGIDTKNDEQDARMDGIDTKNDEQDGRLGDIESGAALDGRYVLDAGDSMSGNLNMDAAIVNVRRTAGSDDQRLILSGGDASGALIRADHGSTKPLIIRNTNYGDEFVQFNDGADTLAVIEPVGTAINTSKGIVTREKGDFRYYTQAIADGKFTTWWGEWDGVTGYPNNAMVIDWPYLAVSLEDNNFDKPVTAAPDPVWAAEGADVLPRGTVDEGTYWTGQRYTWPDGGYFEGYRFQVPIADPSFEYSVLARVTGPDGEPGTLDQVLGWSTVASDGWFEIPRSPTLWLPNTQLELFLGVRSVTQPNTFTANWDVKNTNGNPSQGEANFQNSGTQIRVHDTDKNDTNQGDNLNAVEEGGTIQFAGETWTITSKSDNGSHVRFNVAPTQGRPEENERSLTFTWGSSDPLPVNHAAGFWSGNANVRGIEGTDIDAPTESDSQFGVDVLLREATGSDKWDIMAVSSIGGSGGGGSPGEPGGGASVTIGDAFPTDADVGDLHYLTIEPVGLFVYTDDGTSTQWVQTNGGSGTDEGGGGGASVTVGDDFPTDPAPTEGALHYRTTGVVGLYVYTDDGSSQQWVQTNGGNIGVDVEIVEANAPAGWQVWGDTLIQWGVENSSNGNKNVTFPQAFKTTPTVTVSAFYVSTGGNDFTKIASLERVREQDFRFYVIPYDTDTVIANVPVYWIAIGEAPDDLKKAKTVTAQAGSGDAKRRAFHDPTNVASWMIDEETNTLECWGLESTATSAARTITFPKTFLRPPSVTATAQAVGGRWDCLHDVTTTECKVRARSGTTYDDNPIWWRAIGEWDGVS